MATTNKLTVSPGADLTYCRLQVHLTEYQALMARNTNSLTLQWALWPMALLYLAFSAAMWTRLDQRFLVWSSLAVAQIAALVWCGVQGAQYENIHYIEHFLRDRVVDLIDSSERFWNYEGHLAEKRGSRPLVWEWAVAACSVIALIFVAAPRHVWTAFDYAALTVNGAFTLSIVGVSWHLSTQRRRMASVQGPAAEQLDEADKARPA